MKNYKIFSKKNFIKIIFITILISILCNSLTNNQYNDIEQYAVIVNQDKISYSEIEYLYNMTRNQQRQKLGDFFFKKIDTLSFKKNIYNHILYNLINDILLQQYAKKIGFQITHKSIKNIIIHNPYFKKNGKFDYSTYLQQLKKHGITAYEYEKKIILEKNKEKLLHNMLDYDITSNFEKYFLSQLLSEQRIIKKINIPLSNFLENIKIKNYEIEKHFMKYTPLFITPNIIKLDYFKIQKNKISVQINNNEIKNWYLQHIKKYRTSSKKQYSVIQTNTLETAQKILYNLKKNKKNFSDIAQKQSSDPISSILKGNIGWMTQNQETKEIKKANLTKKNQISKIIKYKTGYVIFKLNKIKNSTIKPLKLVKKTILNEIKYKKRSIQLKYILKIFKTYNSKNSKINLNQIIKKIKQPIQTTNWFTQTSIPKIIHNKKITNFILNTQKKSKKHHNKSIFHHIKINDNINYLIKIKIIKNPKLLTLKQITNKIKMIIKYYKAKQKALEIGKKIISELKINNTYTMSLQHLKFSKPIILDRNNNYIINKLIFKMQHPNKKNKRYQILENKNGDLSIIYFYKIVHNKLNNSEIKIITHYLQKSKSKVILNHILHNLYNQAQIKYGKIPLLKN